MKVRNGLLMASFVAEDGASLLRRVVSSRPEFSSVPVRLSINLDRVEATATWLEDSLARGRRIQANWRPDVHPSPSLLTARPKDGAVGWQLRCDWSIACLVNYVRSIGAWLSVFDDLHDNAHGWQANKVAGDGGRELFGFAQTRAPGWGCMFVGERGHAQLVSRRWLEYGPWLLDRFADDVSLIQFHDLDADPATALAQALPGHRRLGDNDTGGGFAAA